MIYAHLASNRKMCMIDLENIIFAEEITSTDDKNNEIEFTRLYLKQPLPIDNNGMFIDIVESVVILQEMIINAKK